MPKPPIADGTTFGRLTVVELLPTITNRRRTYLCKCSCGNSADVDGTSLRMGWKRSCGCLRREVPSVLNTRPIEPGTRFGRLSVVRILEERRHGKRVFLCQCDCGNETRVTGVKLRAGDTVSCGCYRRDQSRLNRHFTHGLSSHPLYATWYGMHQRCSNPAASGYEYYGGRGISVDPRWDDLAQFIADMGERPEGKTLDRIDNDGNYEPMNCRWATANEQLTNQRPRRPKPRTRTYSERTCPECSTDFCPRFVHARFCCARCANTWRARRRRRARQALGSA